MLNRSRSHPDNPPPLAFLSVNEAAALLRLSPGTLGRWRIEGRHKFGRRVVYSRDDLLACAQAQRWGRT